MSYTKSLKSQVMPLYYQLEKTLRSRLASREFEPGDSLLSEAEIGKQYNVSRITVREALAGLERDGLIRRQRGKGTFVTRKIKQLWVPKLNGSLEDAINLGLTDKFEVQMVSRDEGPASQREAQLLGITPDRKIHRIQRIRLYESQPLAHMTNLLPLDVGSRLSTEDLLNRPVLANLEKKLKIKLAEADQQIGATVADGHVADFLEICAGDPLLQMERTVYALDRRVVNHALVLFRSDRYWYQVKLKYSDRTGGSEWQLA